MGCPVALPLSPTPLLPNPITHYGIAVSDSARLAYLIDEIRGDRFDIRAFARLYAQLGNHCPVGHPVIGQAFVFACRTDNRFGCAALAIHSKTAWLAGLLELCHNEQVLVPFDVLDSILTRIPSNERVVPTDRVNPERSLFVGASMALAQGQEDLAHMAVHKALGVRPNGAIARNRPLLKDLCTLDAIIGAELKQGCPSPRLFATSVQGLPADYQETWHSNHGWLLYDAGRNMAISDDMPLLCETLDFAYSTNDLRALLKHVDRLPKARLAVNFRRHFRESLDENPAVSSLAVVFDESSHAAYCELADTAGERFRASRLNAPSLMSMVEEYRKAMGPLTDAFQDYLFQSPPEMRPLQAPPPRATSRQSK